LGKETVYAIMPVKGYRGDSHEIRLSLCQNVTTITIDIREWRSDASTSPGPTKRGFRLTLADAKTLRQALDEAMNAGIEIERVMRLVGSLPPEGEDDGL